MTVSTTLNKIIYPGNGSTTVFPFTFAMPGTGSTGIQVFFTDALGNIILLSPSAYTLLLNAATGTNPTPAGGSVTYNPLGVPIPTGTFLTIVRTLSLVQSTSLANQGTLYQPVEEAALDYQMMTSQQVLEIQSRALVVPVTDPTPSALPAVAARKLLFLAFDSSGNPIASSPSGASSPVSSAMAPVVAAATLAAGRTAFGLGALATEGIGAGLQDDGAGNARVNFGLVTDTIGQSVVAGFDLTRRQALASITYTFPLSSTLFSGFGFWISTRGFAVTLAPNAADNFDGAATGASLVLPPGITTFVQTNAAGVWYADLGMQVGLNSPLNLQLNASVASNALTISLKDRNGNDPTPVSPIIFTVSAGGNIVTRAITTPLSVTVPTSATLGTVSNQGNRIWVGLIDGAGGPVLAVYNSLSGSSILCWNEAAAISPAAITAGSTSAQTWYAASSQTGKAFRIIGYVESTQATAGTWASAPSTIQLFGPGLKRPGESIQKQTSVVNAGNTVTTTTFVAVSGQTASITPQSAANLIAVRVTSSMAVFGATDALVALSRGTTAATNLFGSQVGIAAGATAASPAVLEGYDLPNTTSSVTYAVQGRSTNGVTVGFGRLNTITTSPGTYTLEEIQI